MERVVVIEDGGTEPLMPEGKDKYVTTPPIAGSEMRVEQQVGRGEVDPWTRVEYPLQAEIELERKMQCYALFFLLSAPNAVWERDLNEGQHQVTKKIELTTAPETDDQLTGQAKGANMCVMEAFVSNSAAVTSGGRQASSVDGRKSNA